ncbi:cytochrome d ubiquinol oxidase subunit II [Pseudonocardia asaccharolytica]|uniref:Cytochrome c oxidase assembly protein n=1 Tax=Pseudonocardia asaccharolytica DSM 44247 = NBRC 16224 TaxID=1123024 RepID=A0A511D2V3_9PSEU|nr:cytochrome d ubiquinol oxidase subunit II [Pseudonocardia asaccharolytica]GEL18853.1 cytochrome c oxidase assembly protein [Pseudonocardia asaccharolytica DSM 44247 = NBRC 16224]
MTLAEFWFLLIGFLFTGYFFLEGFDFGVGMLLPVLAHDDIDRRTMINTIGPVWDLNETWLIVAGASLFAAFPDWYATLFSGFYLPLLLVLLALIVRGVAFEYRGKVDEDAWRRRWDLCIIVGSYVPALLWGVAFANIVRGVPIDAEGDFTGSLLTLLNPYGLLGGVAAVALFCVYGAIFVALKTLGRIRRDARRLAGWIGIAAVVLTGAFLLWTLLGHGDPISWALGVLTAMALVAGLVANAREREGWAFASTGASVIGLVATLFVALFPDVMPSTTDPAFSLTVQNASSTPYTLRMMSWIALIALPFVLAYQGWTYWVFRKRIGRHSIPTQVPHGADALGQ